MKLEEPRVMYEESHAERLARIEREANGAPETDAAYMYRMWKREEKMRSVQRTFVDDVAMGLFSRMVAPGDHESTIKSYAQISYTAARHLVETRKDFIK